MLISEEVSCDFIVETILNDLPNPGEKIELSAEEIKAMLVFVFELYLKRKKNWIKWRRNWNTVGFCFGIAFRTSEKVGG